MDASCQVKQTGWSTAMSNLSSNVAQLNDRVNLLRNRIESVLAPEQPEQPANVASAQTPLCPKAKALMEIDSTSEKVNDIRIIVDEMIQRLEL